MERERAWDGGYVVVGMSAADWLWGEFWWDTAYGVPWLSRGPSLRSVYCDTMVDDRAIIEASDAGNVDALGNKTKKGTKYLIRSTRLI